MTQIERTYLVQRLNKPFPQNTLAKMFAFGGGLKNGGLSDEAMELLEPIFSFDYMGSAEFEWGAIPKCFQSIAKNIKNYSIHFFPINDIPVYVICKTDVAHLIDERIKLLAEEKIVCKENTAFRQALGLSKYSKKEDCRTIGWLELDNDFMFFVSKDAAVKTANLFGLVNDFSK